MTWHRRSGSRDTTSNGRVLHRAAEADAEATAAAGDGDPNRAEVRNDVCPIRIEPLNKSA